MSTTYIWMIAVLLVMAGYAIAAIIGWFLNSKNNK